MDELPSLGGDSNELDAEMPAPFLLARSNTGASTSEDEKTKQFVAALSGVTDGVTGMLRLRARKRRGSDEEGRVHWPFPHQRKCAKRLIAEQNTRMLVCHDAGMGKTFSFLLAVAGIHTLGDGRRPRVLVTAPASCLLQWKAAVLDSLRISERRIMMCNKLVQLTSHAMRNHDFFIVSRDTVGRAFSALFEWGYEDGEPSEHSSGRARRAWVRRPGAAVPALLESQFDILGVDEAHAMRNTTTACTQGHNILSQHSKRVISLTASPVFNSPTDLAGISLACDFPERFTIVRNWFTDAKHTRVDVGAIDAFQVHVDRACESVLNLPPLISRVVRFEVRFTKSEDAEHYNAVLQSAKKLLRTQSRKGQLRKDEAQRLEASVQRLQQMAVSPVLEAEGALTLQTDKAAIIAASVDCTGSLQALATQLASFLEGGFSRVIVCACHTSVLSIAEAYCSARAKLHAEQFLFTGRLSLTQRSEMISAFLSSPRAILFLSIDAGGTGLHICPGCNAVIFWGSRPFTPMKLMQAQKRVHRIGQEHPVHVVHLVGDHSVDSAIDAMHQGKLAVARAVADNNTTTLPRDGSWKMVGRIVDRCGYADDSGVLVPPAPIVPSKSKQTLCVTPPTACASYVSLSARADDYALLGAGSYFVPMRGALASALPPPPPLPADEAARLADAVDCRAFLPVLKRQKEAALKAASASHSRSENRPSETMESAQAAAPPPAAVPPCIPPPPPILLSAPISFSAPMPGFSQMTSTISR